MTHIKHSAHQFFLILFLLTIFVKFSYGQNEPQDNLTLLKLDTEISAIGKSGGVSIDELGYIYVANFDDVVYKISPLGETEIFAKGLYGASGNTLDKEGNLLQSNFYGGNVIKINRDGIKEILVKDLSGPVGLALNDDGDLFVCNCTSNSIIKINKKNEKIVLATGELFDCPNGITLDEKGNVYIVNFNNDNIIKITPDGKANIFASVLGGKGNAHIVYLNNAFYISKIKLNQIFKLSMDGASTLIAGSGSQIINLDKNLLNGINRPNGIAVDKLSGDIYFNIINGEWRGKSKTTIDLVKLEIVTIDKLLKWHLDNKGIESAKNAFINYKNNPYHQDENLGPSMGRLGWSYMIQNKVTEAIALFNLMTETYPERWRAWYYLGDVYGIIGQSDKSLDFYKIALTKSPDNEQIKGKINSLTVKD